MSNLKHGFYSKNPHVNPDSVMLKNIQYKSYLANYQKDIADVVNGKIVSVGVTDLVVRLIDIALPYHEEFLPKSSLSQAWEYYRSSAFSAINRSIRDKSTESLIKTVQKFEAAF